MKNEFGVTLDRNGYAPTVLPLGYTTCFCCCRSDRPIQRHEVFHGSLYRTRSKNLGCWVNVCDKCHMEIHNGDGTLDRKLKRIMQKQAMKHYKWSVDDFRKYFGKSYLEEEDE